MDTLRGGTGADRAEAMSLEPAGVRRTRTRVAALGYHEIADAPGESGFRRPGARPYRFSRAELEAHLDAIAACGASVACVDALDPGAPGVRTILTFDDGGCSALAAAAALERRGWRGHFFIITGRIGTPGFLDAAGIRRIRQAGHVVGSHSHTHPDIFRGLDAAAMAREWQESRDRLEQLLGEPCVHASVPGGDVSQRVFASAAAAGLRWLFTSEPWLVPRRVGGCMVLGRVVLKRGVSAREVAALAAGRGWVRALALRRLKGAARRAAPPLYRLYVERSVRDEE